jgi:hypothetical protein
MRRGKKRHHTTKRKEGQNTGRRTAAWALGKEEREGETSGHEEIGGRKSKRNGRHRKSKNEKM